MREYIELADDAYIYKMPVPPLDRQRLVMATHSPILLALPGAAIVQIEDDGSFHAVDYDSCRTVSTMRGFLDAPERALRYLLSDDD